MKKQSHTSQSNKHMVRPIVWAGGFAALCLAFLVGSVLFEMDYDHKYTPRPETKLRSICQALIIYAANHGDAFPPEDRWTEALIDSEILFPDDFVSIAEDGDGVSYILVADSLLFDPNQIIVYEDPTHYEEGVWVGFGDAYVELIEHDVFEQMLDDQLAKQSQSP